mmetsp:Transcript_4335/g.7398  ORF Transcript_4335/g.7398 Transcript_4335/m.7398 type:complete len:246 (-) Transcript_4335:199-936(-)
MEATTTSWPSSTTRSPPASSHNLAAQGAVRRAASGKSMSTATTSISQLDGIGSGSLCGQGSGSLSGQGSGCLSGQASPPGAGWKLMTASPTGGFSNDSTATGHTGCMAGSERSNEARAGRTATRNSGSSTPSSASLRERRGLQELKVDTDRNRNAAKLPQGTRPQETRTASKTAPNKGPAALHVQATGGHENVAPMKVTTVTKRPPTKPLKRQFFGFFCGSWRRQQSMDSPRREHEYDEKVPSRR